MKAYQRIQRDRRAALNLDADLFGQWWDGLNLSLADSRVRPVTRTTAAPFITQYEWLGTMPAVVYASFGLFFDGRLGGIVVYSPDYAENLGVWDRYGFTGKMWTLSRGACAHWTPTGSASRLIRRSMDQLPGHVEVVSATVDAEAGEVGTVYQAAGWYYVGLMTPGGRSEGNHKGRKISSRQLRRMPHKAHVAVRQVGRKARYFAFRGPNRAAHLAAIRHLVKPYPKRAESSENGTPANQAGRGGVNPTSALPPRGAA